VALDGVEHALARIPGAEDAAVAAFVHELEVGLRGTGLSAVVNLNIATPPPWAHDLAEGPLFAGSASDPASAHLAALTDAVLQALARGPARVRIDWHLSERDFAPEAAGRLGHAARLAAKGAAVAFVFDRPRRLIALAEGVARKQPALLLTVGVHLPRLADLPGASADPGQFLQRLGSLARLALSAAVQKREFLRRHAGDRPGLKRGFFLDRARLMAAPVGLDCVARRLTGEGLCEAKGLDLGRQVVARLRDVLREDGRACLIESTLDAPAGFGFELATEHSPSAVAGVTPWDAAAPVKAQMRAAGAMHAVAEGGTAAVVVDGERPLGAEQVAEWLRQAWSQTEVGRVVFVRAVPTHRQLTLPAGPAV
jgi:hypothetical protein